MSIKVVCPNGHTLKVKDGLAGRTGRCPVCKARVKVPQPPSREVSEDDVISFLGPHDPAEQPDTSAGSLDERAAAESAWAGVHSPPKKVCSKCNREIDVETHICPHCQTYIADIHDM